MTRTPLLLTLVASLVSVAQAAPERVLPIAPGRRDGAWTAYYYVEGQGTTIERAERGGIPIVEHQGMKALRVRISHADGGRWQVGIAKRGWSHWQIDDYAPGGALEFDVAGDLPADARLELHDSDKDSAGPDQDVGATVQLAAYVPRGDGWRHAVIPIDDFLAAAPDLDLGDLLKMVVAGGAGQGESTFYIADLAFRTDNPEKVYPTVKVDQVGYRTGWAKAAKVTPAVPLDGDTQFVVHAADTGAAVFEGTLREAVLDDAPSGDHVYVADFSDVDAPGSYVLDVPGLGRSAAFAISDGIYDGLFRDVARFYYLQRCGVELKPEHAGPYAHRACHAFDTEAARPGGGTWDGSGGWHDAGDMNRYTAWTLHTVWQLLTLYRHYPDKLPDAQLGIPESGNGLPDLLDEIKFEVEWTRRMLIREGADAGKAYDRIHESGVRQPAGVDFYDRRHRIVRPTDGAAVAVVANCAHAYLVFKEFPQEAAFAEECLQDALLAWDYLTTEGSPGDKSLFSAAAILFDATGQQDAHDVVKRLADSITGNWIGQFVWDDYGAGVVSYVLSERPEVDEALRARLRDYFLRYVDASVLAAKGRGYGSPMFEGIVFVWGSNGRIAKIGSHMLMANRMAPNADYVQVAQDCLHWLLGRNPVGTSMVTGYGDPPLGPIYHSMFGPRGPGLPMPPGYLCGGPTPADAPGLSHFPAKCFRPAPTCWELTECSIGYQAPLVYLVGALAGLEGG